MSDAAGQPNTPTPPQGDQFFSDTDAIFADSWNEFFNPDGSEKTDEEREADAAGAAGAEVPPGQEQGTGAGAGGAGEQAPGTQPPAAAPEQPAAPVTDPVTGEQQPPAEQQQPPADPAAPGAEPIPPAGGEAGKPHSELVTQFAAAGKAMEERAEASFTAAVTTEVDSNMNPRFKEAINSVPYLLVGTEVPDLRSKEAGKMTTLRDTTEAQQWQDAAKALREQEIRSRVAARHEDAKPMMSVLQESILMFQNNSDMTPGSLDFDQELADRFAEEAEAFEVRLDGKLLGYEGNYQPLINSIRSSLIRERTAKGLAPTPNPQRQQQAQEQQRTPGGQFEAPQGGIPSKAGQAGEGEESFDDFWRATGLIQPGGMSV